MLYYLCNCIGLELCTNITSSRIDGGGERNLRSLLYAIVLHSIPIQEGVYPVQEFILLQTSQFELPRKMNTAGDRCMRSRRGQYT